jgi:hypothetical protein
MLTTSASSKQGIDFVIREEIICLTSIPHPWILSQLSRYWIFIVHRIVARSGASIRITRRSMSHFVAKYSLGGSRLVPVCCLNVWMKAWINNNFISPWVIERRAWISGRSFSYRVSRLRLFQGIVQFLAFLSPLDLLKRIFGGEKRKGVASLFS